MDAGVGEGSDDLASASAGVSALTVLSRIAGLARDSAIAAVFGASPAADAFFVAFRVPNLFRRLFGEGAFAAGLVPFLATTAGPTEAERAASRRLVSGVAGVFTAVLLAATLLVELCAPWASLLFAPGFAGDAERAGTAAALLRWTFPYLPLVTLTALAGAVLNAHRRFAIPALAPLLLNLCLIAAALVLAPRLGTPVLALGIAVFAAGVLQLALHLPALARLGLLVWPRWRWRDPQVRRVLAVMLPAILGASVAQVNLLVDTWIASFLGNAAVSWLYFADRVVELPVGVLAVGLATVALPHLSRLHADADAEGFAALLDTALRAGVLLTLPAALALTLLARPIVFTLFGYGAFTAHDALMSALALRVYALGVVGFVLVKLLAPGFYARQDTRTPLRIGLICIAANAGMGLALAPYVGHVGLAFATSAAALLNAFLMFVGLRRAEALRPGPGWRRDLLATALGCAVMSAVVLPLASQLEWADAAAAGRAVWLALVCGAGAASYLATLYACGVRAANWRAAPGRAGTGREAAGRAAARI